MMVTHSRRTDKTLASVDCPDLKLQADGASEEQLHNQPGGQNDERQD